MCKLTPPNSECPFVSSPPIREFVTKDNVSNLAWSFKRGLHPVSDWEIRIATETFTLNVPTDYAHLRGNISDGREFNITIADHVTDVNVTTVTASILFNESVLKHVPYVFFKLFRTCCVKEVYSSADVMFKLKTTKTDPPIVTTTTIQPETNSQTQFPESISMSTPYSTSRECRPYISLLVFLSFSVVTSYLSTMSLG